MTQVVEFLRTANVDVERLRRQGPILATGWAATDVQGTEVFERYVYLSRQELDLAIAAFGALAGDLKPDLPGSLFRRSLDLVTCPDHPLYGFYGQTVTPEQGLDQYLAVSIGIPCGSNRILRYTKTQLRSMSERDRAVLR
ncbi:MAG: hypothetical protein HY000_32475 [Planctomycetes bacterium]|nr:hypothetical protein [Planctomycetota bacterium]